MEMSQFAFVSLMSVRLPSEPAHIGYRVRRTKAKPSASSSHSRLQRSRLWLVFGYSTATVADRLLESSTSSVLD